MTNCVLVTIFWDFYLLYLLSSQTVKQLRGLHTGQCRPQEMGKGPYRKLHTQFCKHSKRLQMFFPVTKRKDRLSKSY